MRKIRKSIQAGMALSWLQKDSKRPSEFRFSVGIAFFAFLLVVSTSALIVGYNYYQATKLVRVETERQMDAVGQRIEDRVSAFMEPVFLGLNQIALLATNTDLKENNGLAFRVAVRSILQRHAHVTSVYLGTPQGDFTQIVSFNGRDEGYRFTYRAPVSSAFALVQIMEVRSERNRYVRPLDGGAQFTGRQWAEATTYDPRFRPWYEPAIKSGLIYRTKPYVFSKSKEPGITLALALADGKKGVVGFDLDLKALRTFLESLKITAGSRLSLVTHDGTILAHSELNGVKTSTASNGQKILRLLTLLTAQDKVLRAVRRNATDDRTIDIEVEGRRFLAKSIAVNLGASADKSEHVVLAVPLDEINADAIAARDQSMIVAGTISILVLFIAIFVARQLAKPLEALTYEAQLISELKLSDPITIRSHVREVHQLTDAMQSMKSALNIFGKYVPRTLVKQLVQSGSGGELGGERRDLVIMFCDIADFTTIAEESTSEELLTQLSAYFESQSTSILQHSGTIDKYIGDSVMAFWNAPLPDPDKAFHACCAILEARAQLVVQNKDWLAQGRPAFHTRYGLHLGNVIVGNVGSSERINYTVMGSAANLASRLEGLNKVFGTSILVSASVKNDAGNGFVWREAGSVSPKGVVHPIEIFELVGLSTPCEGVSDSAICLADDIKKAEDWVPVYQEFNDRNWSAAVARLTAYQTQWPDDGLAGYYLARAHYYRENPPAADWDGVEQFDAK